MRNSEICFSLFWVVYLEYRPIGGNFIKYYFMRSKITIEVDFENNNRPVLQILSRNSDDVRDRLISSFIQGLNHTSRWCTIAYMGNFEEGQEQTHKWHIVPIKPSELETESNLMKATVEYIETGKQKISE